jgi:hypothetical protein
MSQSAGILLCPHQDADEGELRHVYALAQEIHTHKHIELAAAEGGQYLNALNGLDIAMEIRCLDLTLLSGIRKDLRPCFLVKVVAMARPPFLITSSASSMKSKIWPL